MPDDDPNGTDDRPPVACTITEERAAERADWMRETLVPVYAGAEAREDGVTVRFDGSDETLRNVARFVTEEKHCCAFADYCVEVSPPYDETRLTVVGPEETNELFYHEFVGRLLGEEPLEPPSDDPRFPNLS